MPRATSRMTCCVSGPDLTETEFKICHCKAQFGVGHNCIYLQLYIFAACGVLHQISEVESHFYYVCLFDYRELIQHQVFKGAKVPTNGIKDSCQSLGWSHCASCLHNYHGSIKAHTFKITSGQFQHSFLRVMLSLNSLTIIIKSNFCCHLDAHDA